MTTILPSHEHLAFRQECIALLNKYAGKLSAQEMLALAAHMVGQIVAMQDMRKMTPKMALKLVEQNIEQGNAEVVRDKVLRG